LDKLKEEYGVGYPKMLLDEACWMVDEGLKTGPPRSMYNIHRHIMSGLLFENNKHTTATVR